MRVKELLQQLGVTQKDLAEKLGMTQTGLSLAISDDGNPPLKRLRQIADALGVSVVDLFSDEAEVGKMVAFLHFKGKSHTPTTLEEIMLLLKEWEEQEFHKQCQHHNFEHIREKYVGNKEIQKLMDELCALVGCDIKRKS